MGDTSEYIKEWYKKSYCYAQIDLKTAGTGLGTYQIALQFVSEGRVVGWIFL